MSRVRLAGLLSWRRGAEGLFVTRRLDISYTYPSARPLRSVEARAHIRYRTYRIISLRTLHPSASLPPFNDS
ncbi:hypothetical protein N657DRAFT_109375 [Parathielavia appendiculata]|uniref:Uncharacterized protein n=1 Tax=Parathielavia appendiculata TaxID=2587402 RepID=A0AAN6TVJ6_9PEZI|nr:hypothetical protein N657DRAFT_109375 [Parathielavia appendiculata]